MKNNKFGLYDPFWDDMSEKQAAKIKKLYEELDELMEKSGKLIDLPSKKN